MTLQEQALAAYEEQTRQEAASEAWRHAEQTQSTRQAFIKFFGCEPDSADGMYAEKDGLQFWIHPGTSASRFYFQIKGLCPICGKSAWSQDCFSLVDLGRMLNNFSADPERHHHSEFGDSSLAEQLQNLILEIVQQNYPA
jgi:hypothetical protein